jgi:hypothetical protein
VPAYWVPPVQCIYVYMYTTCVRELSDHPVPQTARLATSSPLCTATKCMWLWAGEEMGSHRPKGGVVPLHTFVNLGCCWLDGKCTGRKEGTKAGYRCSVTCMCICSVGLLQPEGVTPSAYSKATTTGFLDLAGPPHDILQIWPMRVPSRKSGQN